MNPEQQEQLKRLPKVDALLHASAVAPLIETYSRAEVTDQIRAELDRLRRAILAAPTDNGAIDEQTMIEAVRARLEARAAASYRRVINATGIVLHTNLGRAPLADEALAAIESTARGYSNLEFELETGKRGSRYAHVEDILCELTGAESAIVVNNNAAAVTLLVNTLAHDGEVVTSRGELIEIGGSFRIPDVIERSESTLVEVGATNKTRASDYEAAITDNTRMLLKVHPSNYRIVGFTGAPERAELVALANERGLVAAEDLGSGTLIDLAEHGLPREDTVRDVVASGMHVVTFSGDKLLGGPQAGVIVGRRDLLDRMKKNPLLRALRVDKLTLAALESTLHLYRNDDTLAERLPVLRMMACPIERLQERATNLAQQLNEIEGLTAERREDQSFAGGGSLPEDAIPTHVVAVTIDSMSADTIATRLRESAPPIIARVADDSVLFDLRTLLEGDEAAIVDALRGLQP